MKITKSELKILAMESVIVSELDKDTKIKHLEYIKEKADAYQCIGYILDGKFYNLNESGKTELKKRFVKEAEDKKDYSELKHGASVAGVGSGVGILARGAYKRHKHNSYIDKHFEKTINAPGSPHHGKKLGDVFSKYSKVRPGLFRIAGGMVVGAAGWALYRKIRSAFDDCTKECGTYKINGPERQACMKKCKETFYNKNKKIIAKYKN